MLKRLPAAKRTLAGLHYADGLGRKTSSSQDDKQILFWLSKAKRKTNSKAESQVESRGEYPLCF